MTSWGLTDEMLAEEPWGIERALLEPAKVLTEAVHHDIHWTLLEQLIIDVSKNIK